MLRAVVAGCGRMSEKFLQAAKDAGGVDLVGFVDLDLARAGERRDAFAPGAAVASDLPSLLRDLSPDIVFDIVVPEARVSVATTSLGHGCHVLTEKPMANTMADARAILDAARTAGRVHAVIQNRRYHPQVRRIARLLRDGAIGDVTGIYVDFFIGPHFGGFREAMRHVLLLDMAIHTFDVARLFSGSSPVAVHCREWNPANSWYAHGASAIATFEMASGALVNYRGSWCAEGLRTSWEGAWRVVGTKGSLTWDGDDLIRAETASGDGYLRPTSEVPIPPFDETDRAGGHRGVIEDFLCAVNGGPAPETAGFENIRSLAMCFGAIESAETGLTVDLTKGDYQP